jgi:hypothetical protein
MLFAKVIALALPLVALAAPLKDADLVGVSDPNSDVPR